MPDRKRKFHYYGSKNGQGEAEKARIAIAIENFKQGQCPGCSNYVEGPFAISICILLRSPQMYEGDIQASCSSFVPASTL